MSDVWFTSDTHFGHRMLIERGYRPFSTVQDMDEALATAWNEIVKPDDVVWHVGDWSMGGPGWFGRAAGVGWVSQLHGHVHLITGNHDKPWPGNRDAHKHQAAWLAAGFKTIQAFARRRINGQQVLLSHFPYEGDHTDDDRATQFRLPDLGLPLLHGHVHEAWKVRGRQINVGVDVWDFRPVHLDTIATLLPKETP